MLTRRSFSGRNSAADGQKGDVSVTGGYVKVFLKPLEQGTCNIILGWLGMKTKYESNTVERNIPHIAVLYGLAGMLTCLVLYVIVMTDLGYLFQRICDSIEPMFCIVCAFYWLALYFRKSWSTTSIYLLFCSCFAGEFLGQCICNSTYENYITQPLLAMVVLVVVSIGSMFSTLQTIHSVFVIGFVSFVRFLACTSLSDLPQIIRPILAYFCGIMGTIGAKYMETAFKPPVNNHTNQEGKIPIIKRRRSSSSTAHNFTSHRAGRRTSLPALIQKTQTSSSRYEMTIIGEAHGLITDMLADSSLPPHVVSGLNAISNLLKHTENHAPIHKARVSPLVSLTETSNHGSDSEEIPYTGERPSSLPKRLRRSLPPSLIRRMSTSTWTTTTSATGMPTLEPEPCRTRSCSFRHSRDNTPGSSPTNSCSNSPSPSSPSTISLTIPKSRSFSTVNTLGFSQDTTTNPKRVSRERRGLHQHEDTIPSPFRGQDRSVVYVKVDDNSKELASKNTLAKESLRHASSVGLSKRFNITSDYESSDSPSSSDHSDSVMTLEETGGSVSPARVRTDTLVHKEAGDPGVHTNTDYHHDLQHKLVLESGSAMKESLSTNIRQVSISGTSAVRSSHAHHSLSGSPSSHHISQRVTQQDKTSPHSLLSRAGQILLQTEPSSDMISQSEHISSVLPYDMEAVMRNKLCDINMLNQWDYPVFDLSLDVSTCILSMVACRLFSETGLFDTFRIPIEEFINYFHAVELGYREKPYHNRIHATDVLHGVYYLTTQPIPGFQQINPESDFAPKGSSSESDSDCPEKGCTHTNFTAEDSYGIMGGNLPPLELMALYTAAAMHDYDHPGRTNAFLVTTNAPLAILYNDRSVLESHHAASAWSLYLTNPSYHWLVHLDKAEFKRFRFLVIEAILATDLKRHFELLAEFNAKVNEEDSTGIDWTNETDRLMTTNMIIKMADINGPAKKKELHFNWTNRISEEFYEQGDEEQNLGLPISPYMDRKHPQLAKLQESFINHLVAPLCNALGAAGLLPGTWEDITDDETAHEEKCEDTFYKDTEEECLEHMFGNRKKYQRKMYCQLLKNLQDNHDMWVKVLRQEMAQKERDNKPVTEDRREPRSSLILTDTEIKPEMEPIKEEDTPPNSAHSLGDVLTKVTDKLLNMQAQSEAEQDI